MVFRYDVFFCFQNSDLRRILVSRIRSALQNLGVKVYEEGGRDHEHEMVLHAIEASKVVLIILSRDFFSSAWCMEELEKIIYNWERNGQVVVPIFHHMKPIDILKGETNKMLAEHGSRVGKEKVDSWKYALIKTAALPSRVLKWDDYESKFVGELCKDIVEELTPNSEAPIRSKSRYFKGMTFLVITNLVLETISAVADQLSSTHRPLFARISLIMSILSVFLSIVDLTYKIQAHKARLRCKGPIPWFYYPSRGYNRIFGNLTDMVLLVCGFGQLIVSGINYSSIQRRQDGPIKISVWPLLFAIGMVISKFMEKPSIWKND